MKFIYETTSTTKRVQEIIAKINDIHKNDDLISIVDGTLSALEDELATYPEGKEYFLKMREEQEKSLKEMGDRLRESLIGYPEK